MAITARSIVSLNDVKEYLGIGRATTDKDAMLEKWIDWISGKFESDIENIVKAQSKTVYLGGSGEIWQIVPWYPVIQLATPSYDDVQYRTGATEDWTAIVDDVDLISIDAEHQDRITLLDGYTFPVGDENIKIQYIAGYVIVPGDIAILVLEAMQTMWNNSRQGGNQLGFGSSTMTTTLGSASVSNIDSGGRWNEVVRRYKKSTHGVELYR